MNDNNIIEQFFEQVKEYVNLSAATKEDWASLLKLKVYERGDYFIRVGQIPRNVALVARGLFSQYYISQEGTSVTVLLTWMATSGNSPTWMNLKCLNIKS